MEAAYFVLVAVALYFLADRLAQQLLDVSSENFQVAYDVVGWTLIGAPLLSAMASYLPTLSAVSQDPAVVLMET